MHTRAVLTTVTFAFVVAGCASPRGEGAGACNEHVCHATVRITDCAISIDPDPLPVDRKSVEIHWDIVSPGYTFADDGIRLKDDDPRQEFDHLHRTPNGLRFMANDKNSFAKTYRYGVKIMRGDALCTLDPSIVNHG